MTFRRTSKSTIRLPLSTRSGAIRNLGALPQSSWGVSAPTARLLNMTESPVSGSASFLLQIEASKPSFDGSRKQKCRRKHNLGTNSGAAEQANAVLLLARSRENGATGAGKTTVMAMLSRWQDRNAVRAPTRNSFSRGFLIIAPASQSKIACAYCCRAIWKILPHARTRADTDEAGHAFQ